MEKANNCTGCGHTLSLREQRENDHLCFDCVNIEVNEMFADDNGPTGHGDICYSDADPGL